MLDFLSHFVTYITYMDTNIVLYLFKRFLKKRENYFSVLFTLVSSVLVPLDQHAQ